MANRTSAQRSLFLIDLENPSNKLEIQNVPLSLEYDFDNKIVAVASPGRNNPFYFFTGSEDTLEFEISWYAATQSRADVIKSAKWLEGMSKNDGYNKPPKMVGLQWTGTSITAAQLQNEDGSFSDSVEPSHWDNQLFQFSTWLIRSAPFSLSLFHKTFNMLPTLATQKVKLIRVTPKNSTRSEVSDLRY